MYLKKFGKVFTSKFVGARALVLKKNLPGCGLTEVEKHWSRHTGADQYVASTNPDRCL
jgi:hypothetical protein